MKDKPCPNCESQLFVHVLGTWTEGEHPDWIDVDEDSPYDKDTNSFTTNVGQKCIECDTIRLAKDIPDGHEQKFGLPDGAFDQREDQYRNDD